MTIEFKKNKRLLPVDLKAFHYKVINDSVKLQAERQSFLPLPQNGMVAPSVIQLNYQQIREMYRK